MTKLLFRLYLGLFCICATSTAFADTTSNDAATNAAEDVIETPLPKPYLLPKAYFDAKTLANTITSSATLNAAAGATRHLESIRQRGWLNEAIPLDYDYPDDLYYTVASEISVNHQASIWGIPTNTLLKLNTQISFNTQLQPGMRLRVMAKTASSALPYSSGPTNRGRLTNGWLMPEGDEHSGYFLRTERSRSWATENTIKSLIAGFSAYAKAYPGAPRVNVGDFSKRRGGKIKPHSSHTSGRDVDIGFVHKSGRDTRHPEHFIRATNYNLDAEKTWFVLKSIIQTGEVKSIYIDASVQKQLYKIAKSELSDQQLKAIFSLPRHKHSSSSIFQHWPGHKNHAHIRFICPANQPRCRK